MMLKQPLLWLFLLGIVAADPTQTEPNSKSMLDLSVLFTQDALQRMDKSLYEAQQAGEWYAGNLQVDSGGRSLRPVHISIPRINTYGGCEMIDIYGGGISFVSDERYISDLLQKIISNSGTYAFNLALSEFSPVIKSTLDQIAEVAQRVNTHQIDSCEMAQKIVDPLYAQVKDQLTHLKSLESLGTNKTDSYAKAKSTEGPKVTIKPHNITLEVLGAQNGKVLSSQETALALNLLGTFQSSGDVPNEKEASQTASETSAPLVFFQNTPQSFYDLPKNSLEKMTMISAKDFFSRYNWEFLSAEAIGEVLYTYIEALKIDKNPLDSETRKNLELLVNVADFPVLPYLNASVSCNRGVAYMQIAEGIREAILLKAFEKILSTYEYNLKLVQFETNNTAALTHAEEILKRARQAYFKIASHRSINISNLIAETQMMENLMAENVAKEILAWQKSARRGG